MYEHDALVTPGLPLRWHDVGGFAVAERARGMRAIAGRPWRSDRRRSCATSSGSTCRCSGLPAVPRLAWADWAPAGRPSTTAIARCAAAPARFLAGWDRWLVLEEHGRFRRENLVAGSRQELGAVGRAVLAAAAIPGSPNAVLFSLEDGGLVRIV